MGMSPGRSRQSRRRKPRHNYRLRAVKTLIAGVCLLIAGIEGMLFGGQMTFLGADIGSFYRAVPGADSAGFMFSLFGVLLMICGLMAFLGGVMAATRNSWKMAFIGSVLGLFCIGYLFTATLLSLVALILVLDSKGEF